jgi:hypothetical protein
MTNCALVVDPGLEFDSIGAACTLKAQQHRNFQHGLINQLHQLRRQPKQGDLWRRCQGLIDIFLHRRGSRCCFGHSARKERSPPSLRQQLLKLYIFICRDRPAAVAIGAPPPPPARRHHHRRVAAAAAAAGRGVEPPSDAAAGTAAWVSAAAEVHADWVSLGSLDWGPEPPRAAGSGPTGHGPPGPGRAPRPAARRAGTCAQRA